MSIVAEYVGIDRNTWTIRKVSHTDAGKLIYTRDDGTMYTHPLDGRPARSVVMSVFGLTDVFSYSPAMADSVSTQQQWTELRAKLGELKP
ncbi:hypothetical protein [Phenylobacterium sp.]|uniref:hypothetical protein n=1 Tax=Phenylobacterium sp. TaxID=1871053 RepID=UPI0035C856F1